MHCIEQLHRPTNRCIVSGPDGRNGPPGVSHDQGQTPLSQTHVLTSRRILNLLLMVGLVMAVGGDQSVADDATRTQRPEVISIESVVVTISEQVSVPAADAGMIAEVLVKPGDLVAEGDLIARLRDDDVRLLVDRTRINAEIAAKESSSDLDSRYAAKTTEVARTELARSIESNAKYAKTVSNSELDRQRLLVDQGELETQRAEHQQQIAGLTHQIRDNEHRSALDQLALRKMTAPLKGMVVEVRSGRGEWVQPGDAVARIIRLDRLRVEGFLSFRLGVRKLVGRAAEVTAQSDDGEIMVLPGKVVFVSPEIDPLNDQVRVWIDIENDDLKLWPGMIASVKVMMQ
jgi:multidrug efflux pump subunit AcrA (membrane-fusion protein)